MQQIFKKAVMLVAFIGFQQISALSRDVERAAFKVMFLSEKNKISQKSCYELDLLYQKAAFVGIPHVTEVKSVLDEIATEKYEQLKRAKLSHEEEAAAKAMLYAVEIYHLIRNCSR